MLRSIIMLVFVFYHVSVVAGEMGLIVNGKSIHLGAEEGESLNEENWGAGLQYSFEKTEEGWVPFIQLSGFIDSNNNNSYYAGGGYVHQIKALSTQDDALFTSVGACAFLMSRKKSDGNDLIPGLLPVLVFGTRHIYFNVTYVPKFSSDTVPLYFIQAVIPVGEVPWK